MRTYQVLKNRVCFPSMSAWLLGAALLLLPGAAWGDDLTVDCTGGTPGAFTSITSALSSLDLQGPHTITVVGGSCNEKVRIIDRERVTITAAPVGAFITSPDGGVPIVISGSHGITLIQVGAANSSFAGVRIDRHSEASLRGVTIENNGGTGVVVRGGSTVDFNGLVQGNGGSGLNVDENSLANLTHVTIENNGGFAISVSGGRLRVTGTPGENIIRGNAFGVNIVNGAAAFFSGQNTIQNNGILGIQVATGSSATFSQAVGPGGTIGVTVVEGHTILGVNVVRFGEVGFTGQHKIRNNGSITADPLLRSGIRVSRGSLTVSGGTEITNNIGPGIRAEINSSIVLTSATINNNTEEGIRVTRMSVAGFTPPLSIAGNATASVSCDVTSLVFGDLTGIANVSCPRVERELGPPRPGQIH